MIELYTAATPNGQKIHIMLEEVRVKRLACHEVRAVLNILHRMWRDGTDFIWSTKEAAA